MKKTVSAFLFFSFVLTLISLGYVANAQVAIGSRSEEVKAIQEILKTDPKIYPEGYVTGYYGPLTTNAVKRLQKRCGLSETGVIDEETEKCIFPREYTIKIMSPNGEEVWDRSQIQTIKWEVIGPDIGIPEIKPYPFWPKVSIDLFRRVPCPSCPEGAACLPCPIEGISIFVRHIATVNLFDRIYSWKITPDIPNGSDYVIRISIGKNIVPIWAQEIKTAPGTTTPVRPTEIWPVPPSPRLITWDDSDGLFTIIGEIIKPTCPNLGEVIAILEKIIDELQRAIALLKSI